MISLIICLIGGLIVGLLKRRWKSFFPVTKSAVIGFLIWLIIAGISLKVFPYELIITEGEEVEIIASNDSNGAKAFLFLVWDEVNEEFYYRFYTKAFNKNDNLRKITISEKMVISEEEREDAYLAKRCKMWEYPRWFYFWLVPKYTVASFFYQPSKTNIIHVPIGTIKIGHKLNLE